MPMATAGPDRATETVLWVRATLGRGDNCFMCDSLATAMDCTARWLDLSSMRLTYLHGRSLNAVEGYPAASLSEYFGRRLPVRVAHDEISRATSPEGRAAGNDAGMPLEVDQGSRPFVKAPQPSRRRVPRVPMAGTPRSLQPSSTRCSSPCGRCRCRHARSAWMV